MILGNGLIANSFKKSFKHDDIIVASGVSNSLEKSQKNFNRELSLIRDVSL